MKASDPLRRAARSPWAPPIGSALITLVAVVWRLDLWRYDLRVPLIYWGDALYLASMVKGLIEGPWNYYIPYLGAPFGMAALDFPLGCTLDFAIMKLLSFVIHDGCLLINLYWLLNLCLAGAFATLFFAHLRVSPIFSVCFGVLYAVIPFTFYRNISHLNLVHFLIPAAAYLGTSLWSGPPSRITENQSNATEPCPSYSPGLGRVLLCIAIGLAFAYWAFFSCIVIAVCSVIAFFRHRTAKAFGLALLYIVIISITAVVAMTGSLLYWHQHGLNTAMHYKSPSEADTYGLSVRQMLTPIIEHPLPALAAIRRKIASANFPSDATESQMASLGSIGSLGFLLLTLIAVARPSRGILSDTRLAQLAGLSIALVLVAEIGGFGSLFNALILHEFRCYNRISPFISLFSFAAIAIVLDDLLRQRQGVIRYGIFISIVLAGLFDQIPVALFRSHRAEERRFYDDRYFIQELERRLPANAMIFQLPHTGFPMDAGQNKMAPYDNARAYLHSHNLRWPWGAMDGRNGDWSKTVASLPMKQFLEQIESAGFEGILLDRYGYPDSRLERQAVAELGASNRFDRGGRWVFFDLRASRNNLTASLTPAERTKRQDIARYPIGVIWLPAFSVEERNADQTWHWCGRTGIIRLVNDSDIHREVEIDALLQNGSRGPDVLRIDRQGRILNFDLGQDLTPYHDRIALEAHQLVQVSFSFSGPLLAVPGDSRELAFRVVDFRLKEVTQ